MAGLFQQVGLNCIAQKYINALGALGWWANGRLRKQDTPPSGQLRLFNRAVPTIKRVDGLCPCLSASRSWPWPNESSIALLRGVTSAPRRGNI